MAKKKTPEAVEETAPVIVPAEASVSEVAEPVEKTPEAVEETAPEDSSIQTSESETPASVDEVKSAVDLTAIPMQAIDYLKRHTEVDAVYIDKFGGLFPKNTPKVFVKDAILYQNPYFKQ